MSEYQSNRDFVPASKWSLEDRIKLLSLWEEISRPPRLYFSVDDLFALIEGGKEEIADEQESKDVKPIRSDVEVRRLMYWRIMNLLNFGLGSYGTSIPEIAYFAGEQNVASEYHSFKILKRNGSTREIIAPSERLKKLQQQLLIVLTILSRRHKACHGFEPGRSIVTHAKNHVGKQWVITVDLEDFFPTVSSKRVYGLFRAEPFKLSSAGARYFTNVVCVKGHTPQGAPTSPIIANLICRGLDSRLYRLARQNGFQYSRYADDIAFSTNRSFDSETFLKEIRLLIEDEGFRVNDRKTKIRHRSRRQIVTGLVVNEKLNIPKDKLRSMRAFLFNVKTFGLGSQLKRSNFDDSQRTNYRSEIRNQKIRVNSKPALYHTGSTPFPWTVELRTFRLI